MRWVYAVIEYMELKSLVMATICELHKVRNMHSSDDYYMFLSDLFLTRKLIALVKENLYMKELCSR